MVWHHWFIRHQQANKTQNNAAALIHSPPESELLAWSLEPRMLFDGAVAATVNEAVTTEATPVDKASASSESASAAHSETSQTQSPASAQDNNSATPAVTNTADTTPAQNQQNQNNEKETVADVVAPASGSVRHEVAFIDTSLADYQTLVAGIAPGIDVVLIDGSKDGLQQLAEWASTHSGYDAIHIFSHGSEGKISLGSGILSNATLTTDTVQAELATIGKSLSRGGDILLYGCDVAAGNDGDALISGIASATGADVAASINATGSSLIGGDWTLEKTVGTVDAAALHVDGYQDLLTVLVFSHSDGDTNFTQNSITRAVDNYQFTFSTASTGYIAADAFFRSGQEGLFGYNQGSTLLIISGPSGTTFDIAAMKGAADTSVHFKLDYTNGTSVEFDLTLNSDTSMGDIVFPQAINDVMRVTISSNSIALFQNIEITDVQSLAPVIGNLNGDSVTFIEGGSPVLLDVGGNATLTDSDSTDFNGGNVTVTLGNNSASSEDVLSVQNNGQITVSGSSVSWGGTQIGTLSGGTNGDPLVISLNASATPARVQDLLHALAWSNSNSSDPSTATRSVTITVNDGDGGTSTAASVTVNVAGVNDAPTLTATSSTPTYTENGSAVSLFSGAAVGTVESGQTIANLTLSVSNVMDGSDELLGVNGSDITLTNGTSGTLGNGMSYSVIVSNGTAIVTLHSAAGVSSSIAAALVNGMTYRNSSEDPTAGSRMITLTSVTDSGGTSNGGVDTTVLSIASAVTVVAVNDAPTITAPATISVTEDQTATLRDISFADVDGNNGTFMTTFAVSSGTISFLGGAGSISITVGSSLSTINSYIANGMFTFTPASNANGPVTLTITINDQGNSGTTGSKSASLVVTLDVIAVNDTPINVVPTAQSVEQGSSLTFSSGNGNAISIIDVDAGTNAIQVSLTANNGLLTLGSTSGLSFIAGTGVDDNTMTVLGSLADINTALNGLKFTPRAGYAGAASVQIVTNDLGNSGTGGALTDTDTINITVTSSSPVITGVSAAAPDGIYKVGDTVLITVDFSEVVFVDTTGGTPTLQLETGVIDRVATYIAGSGSGTLTFSYTVQSGDSSADLDYISSSALALNGATIFDNTFNNAQLTLAAPGTTDSLGAQKNIVIDGVRPTATITMSDSVLKIGETSVVTINFSEAVTGLTLGNLSVNSGTLSNLASSDGGITWTATFTPTEGVESTQNLITLDNTGVMDQAGNAGIGTTDSNNYAIDTQHPTATIVVSDDALAAGETSLVTITFSEAVTGFSNANLTVNNGTLSAVSSSDGGITWTATFTPTAGVNEGLNIISLANAGVTDQAGNPGIGTTDSNNYVIDTQRPTVSIVMADRALTAGETSLVTLTFSEAITGLDLGDLHVDNGTLSNLSSSDGGITWTATFTPTAGVESASNLIIIDNTGYKDLAGNTGVGVTFSASYAIDTQRPTATIVVSDDALTVGETSLVTITFSEAVTGFSNANLTVNNGTLSAVSSSDGGITWTATFTPTAGVESTHNLITLDNTGIADQAGNTGTGTTDSNNYAIDTQLPTATIALSDTAFKAGETAQVTITFSEAVTGFDLGDLSVSNGTLSNLSSSDGGITWKAIFTPDSNVTASGNHVTLNNSGVQDLAGNQGVGVTPSASFSIDSAPPQASALVITSADARTLSYQLDFSEAVTGVDLSDFTVITTGNMTASIASITAVSATRYVIQLTGVTGAGSVQLVLNGGGTDITDAAGNVIGSGLVGAVYENHAPATDGIADQTVAEDSTLHFTLPANAFTDNDAGDSLTLTATLANGQPLPSWLTFDAATRTFSGTPDNADVGTLSLRVTATDTRNVSVAVNFALTVTNTNDAPTASPLSDTTVTSGDSVSIRIPSDTFSDVDVGDSLTLSATLANGSPLPSWLQFDATTGTLSGSSTGLQASDLLIRITATDSAGASVSSDFTLHILASTRPEGNPQFRLNDGRPMPGMDSDRDGVQSQLALLSLPTQSAPLPGSPGDRAPTLAGAFQPGRPAASALSTTFNRPDLTPNDVIVPRTQQADLSQATPGRSLLASVFGGGLPLPEIKTLEVFSGSSWKHVSPGETVATSAFGAPTLNAQLQHLHDDELRQIASLEGALQNIKLPV